MLENPLRKYITLKYENSCFFSPFQAINIGFSYFIALRRIITWMNLFENQNLVSIWVRVQLQAKQG